MPTTNPIQIKPGGMRERLTMLLPYPSERAEKIKTVVGRRWHQQEKHWASTLPEK